MPENSSDTPLAKRSFQVGVWGLIVGVLGVLVTVFGLQYVPHGADRAPAILKPKHCPRLFDRAHQKLKAESTTPPPPPPGIRFEPSVGTLGRVDAVLAWINRTELQEAAVAVEGPYGRRNLHDDFIDQQQPSASPGECWNWYTFSPRDDSQPTTVRARVEELWPIQHYCFYTAYKNQRGGWSKPSAIFCRTAKWRRSWGEPAEPLK